MCLEQIPNSKRSYKYKKTGLIIDILWSKACPNTQVSLLSGQTQNCKYLLSRAMLRIPQNFFLITLITNYTYINVVAFFEKSLGFSAKLHMLPNKDLAKFGPFLCKLFLVRAILIWREQSLSLNDYSLQLQIVHAKKGI